MRQSLVFYLDYVIGECFLGGQVTSLSDARQLGNGRSVLDLLGAYRLSSGPPKGDSVCVLMKKGSQRPVSVGLFIQIEPKCNFGSICQEINIYSPRNKHPEARSNTHTHTLCPSLFLSFCISHSFYTSVCLCLTHSLSNPVFLFFSLSL